MIDQKIKEFININKLMDEGYRLLKETENIEKFNKLIELGANPLKYNEGYYLLETENMEKFNKLIELGANPLNIDKGYHLLKTENIEKFEILINLGCVYDDKIIDNLEKAIVVKYPPLNNLLKESKDEILDMIKNNKITKLHLRNKLIRKWYKMFSKE